MKENLPKPKKELTPAQYEKLLEVSVSNESTLTQVWSALENHDEVFFVVTKDFRIYLSAISHVSILNSNGIHGSEEWVKGFISKNGGYTFYRDVKNQDVIESKIKKFLKKEGMGNN